jgi:putative FmdB family regulatory protein
MPRYDFECNKCQKVYEELVSYDEKGKYPSVKCPECGSKKKKKLLSPCNFQFSNPEGTDRWNSESSGHDYRFHYNLPKVLDERRHAEEVSHVGNTPYNSINDLENDASWGDIK